MKDLTVVIPSYNQGQYLDHAISSVFNLNLNVEVFVMDGGSTDNSLHIIKKWSDKLSYWRSFKDNGQAAAINEGVKLGSAPFVTWLNSDDFFYSNNLKFLFDTIKENSNIPAIYGDVNNYIEKYNIIHKINVEDFCSSRLIERCFIAQPGTLIRKSVWEHLNGLDENFTMSMDFDLWWRIYSNFGPLKYVNKTVAVNRDHKFTKTNNYKKKHYIESITIIKKYNGYVPIRWLLAFIYSFFFKNIINSIKLHLRLK
jgi:glycosyltransferase involved in cell wall biosynthesis